MNDYKLAAKSLQEEKKAIKDYGERREQSENPKLKSAFTHAIGEEKTHAKMFNEVIKKKPALTHDQKMIIIKKAHDMVKK